MFALDHYSATLAKLNLRTECHGNEDVAALDIFVAFNVSNRMLDELAEGLRRSLYDHDDNPAGSLLDERDHLVHLRYDTLAPLDWLEEWEHCGVVIDTGTGKKSELTFSDATVGKLSLAPKEGGTVACKLRIQVLPQPVQTAKLAAMLKHDVSLTLDLSKATNPAEDPETLEYENEGES
ncbi:hypothetical protein QF001_003741 [Paraburkholderia youngii]|uniref:hypothetical protein n=1 Tax=Paraburkholderia youngii TaxID=2782701 RepID=UPI003D1D8767